MLVKDLMTGVVETLGRNERLSIADRIMRLGRIRHLPVVDDDGQTLVGLVSQRDLFRGALATALGYGVSAQSKLMESLLVKDVMHTDVVTTTAETSLRDAAQVMAERKLGCLPVVDGDRLVGILTEGDFTAYVARHG
jgi:CBS domain-containing protein